MTVSGVVLSENITGNVIFHGLKGISVLQEIRAAIKMQRVKILSEVICCSPPALEGKKRNDFSFCLSFVRRGNVEAISH